MEGQLLRYKQSDISHYRFGRGPLPVICFHGYGEEATAFAFLDQPLGELFTFYAIDLPFHGKTAWREKSPFTPDDLVHIVTALAGHEKKITLMGFSLGGRMVLSLFEQMPGRVEKMVLMAPDGLKVNAWYWLATQTRIGNRFFALTMKRPSWFFALLKGMNKLGWVNASIFKFVNHYIGDATVRRLLYQRWTTLRKIKPGLAHIKSLIRENKVKTRLIYGKHDRIILSSVGERFRKGIEAHCTIAIIHSGHQVLHEKHAGEIIPALLNGDGQ